MADPAAPTAGPGAVPTGAVDPDALKAYSFNVWSYKQGEMVSLMIHIGDRLGLYRDLAANGPASSSELAARTGLNERFLREWLRCQAAAKVVGVDDDERFSLPPEGVAVLADEESSLFFSAGAFRGGVDRSVLDLLVDAFRTGLGVTYEQQGPDAAAGLARMTGPWSRIALVPTIVPALDGVEEKLRAGATACDVGCGAGVTLSTLAAAFPASRFVGYDHSSIAVAQARERAEAAGLGNVEFVVAGGDEVPAGSGFDLVLTFDCLHDMAHPDRTAAAIRGAIADDGTWLVKDIRSSGDFARDRRNPLLAMFYAFSVSSCLQSAMSEPDGMGLGTLGLHPRAVDGLVRNAGFTRIHQHDFDDNANLYYEVRP